MLCHSYKPYLMVGVTCSWRSCPCSVALQELQPIKCCMIFQSYCLVRLLVGSYCHAVVFLLLCLPAQILYILSSETMYYHKLKKPLYEIQSKIFYSESDRLIRPLPKRKLILDKFNLVLVLESISQQNVQGLSECINSRNPFDQYER